MTCAIPVADEECPRLENDGFASWPSAIPGTIVSAANGARCMTGYSGTPQRLCGENGWGPITSECTRTRTNRRTRRMSFRLKSRTNSYRATFDLAPHPSAIQCLSVEVNQATFPTATAGDNFVKGKCTQGYAGAPLRNCSETGAWVTIDDSCTGTKTHLSSIAHIRPAMVD